MTPDRVFIWVSFFLVRRRLEADSFSGVILLGATQNVACRAKMNYWQPIGKIGRIEFTEFVVTLIA